MTASFSVASSRSIVLQFEEVNSVTLLKLYMKNNVKIISICHLCTFGSLVQPRLVSMIYIRKTVANLLNTIWMEGIAKSFYGLDHLGQLGRVLSFQMTFVLMYEVHSSYRAFELLTSPESGELHMLLKIQFTSTQEVIT